MIYLDNGATTFKKPLRVKYTVIKNVLTGIANPGRGGHSLSLKTGMQVMNTREKIKKIFHADEESEVIFTLNCTEALNLILLGTAKKNGHIITTTNEHNSVLRPLEHLTKTADVTYSVCTPRENGKVMAADIEKLIKTNTYLIIVNQTSNVTGATCNIEEIGAVAKKYGILFAIDVAQSAGHENINMKVANANFIAFAGHKGLYGLQGVGGLVLSHANISPIKFGGTGTNSLELVQPQEYPEKLESGTLNTPNILALSAGVDFVNQNFAKIQNKTYQLTNYLLTELKLIKHVKCYSHNPHSGVVSFEIENLDSNMVSNILNEEYDICVRSGLHCAPFIHRYLKTENRGLVRVSISYFNTKNEIKKLIKAIKEIIVNEIK